MTIKKRWWLIAGLIAISVGGCKTAEQQLADAAAADDASCRSYGAVVGTPVYVQCRLQKEQERQEAEASRRVLAAGILSGAGNAFSHPAYVAPAAAPLVRPMTVCSSNRVGGQVTTSCF
jgi:hypothetical protein